MEIKYSKQAVKFLSGQNVPTKERIVSAINRLPSGYGDIKKLRGEQGYRLRVGDFRVIFSRDGCILYIEKIDSRGQVYKK